VSGNLF
ncbi:hypothetical protein CP8484711_1950B, partial [Chlamydia psittaci 84-8471/1]